VILVDTSGLLAALDGGQTHHAAAAAALATATPPLILSPFVLAELDHLVSSRVGNAARMQVLDEVAGGAYVLQPFSGAQVGAAESVIARYADLGISLADASIVVLAAEHRINDVLTLDERHFRVLTVSGKPFRLLPADA
jgi:uncharacterized protein